MSHSRSTVDRRRRVVYRSQQVDSDAIDAAGRRAQQQLREARKPAAAYGARVNRRLRGRWFSLVPVRRSALVIFAASVTGCSLLLTLGHYAAMTWPAMASPDYLPIARPLRLDSPESFGRWWTAMLLVLASGTALLIYQLRRHRNNDYLGHYRIWRLVLVTALFASVNSIAGIIDWMGAILDLAVGRRVALSGSDWSRIVLTVGGIIFAFRLIVEVRQSRWAVTWMSAGWILLAIPVAVMWNILPIGSLRTFALVTCTPLLGYACLWLALVGYLRMLFREVRHMDDVMVDLDSWKNSARRLRPSMPRWLQRDESENANDASGSEQTSLPKHASRQTTPTKTAVARTPAARTQPAEPQPADARRPSNQTIEADQHDVKNEAASVDRPQTPCRSWWSRLRPQPKAPGWSSQENADKKIDSGSQESSGDEESTDDQSVEPCRGLRSFFPRKSKPAVAQQPQDNDQEDERIAVTNLNTAKTNASSGNGDDVVMDPTSEDFDESQVDWASLSKTERRRLRKLMKRSHRAA